MRFCKMAAVAVFVFGSLCHAQLSQITASNIVGGDGKKLAHGEIDFSPVTLAGNPIQPQLGGGGVVLYRPAQCIVTNGVIVSALDGSTCTTADTGLSMPAHFCYKGIVKDTSVIPSVIFPPMPCLQPTGAVWSLDSGYVPSTVPGEIVSTGPIGPQGPQGPQGSQGPQGPQGIPGPGSPVPMHSAIVISGDSICANTPGLRWTDLIMSMSQFSGRVDANHNTCVAGRTIEQVAAGYATEVAPFKPSVTGKSPTYLFVEAGSNSLSDGADSPATAYAAIAAYWAQAQGDGFTVVAMTVLPRGSSSGGSFTGNNIETYNSLVRAGLPPGSDPTAAPPVPSLYSKLFDVNTVLNDPYDPVIFSIENGLYVHPNYSGQFLIAEGVNQVFGGPVVPIANFDGRRGSYSFTCDTSGLPPSLNTGSFNTACGVKDLTANTTGSYNTALGADNLYANTTGSNNTAIGSQSGFLNTTGADNTGVGTDSLLNNVSGNDNTGVGFYALGAATGSGSTAVGSKAGQHNTTGLDFAALGYLAGYLNSTGNYNTAVGSQALQTNSTGNDNTAVGAVALNQTTASDNTAVGYWALTTDSTGTSNTAVGSRALQKNDTGNYNTAVGYLAGYLNTASDLTAVGYEAAQNNTAADNTAVGYLALNANSAGTNNTALGSQALVNTTGTGNTAVGYWAAKPNTTGTYNVAIGPLALYGNTTGSYNVAMGNNAGRFQADGATLLVPNNSVYLGAGTRGKDNSDSSSVVIGYNAIGLGTNTIVIGNCATQACIVHATGAPSGSCVNGSTWSRTDGGTATTNLYWVCGNSVWQLIK